MNKEGRKEIKELMKEEGEEEEVEGFDSSMTIRDSDEEER